MLQRATETWTFDVCDMFTSQVDLMGLFSFQAATFCFHLHTKCTDFS